MPSKELPTDPENKNPFLENLEKIGSLDFKYPFFKDFWKMVPEKGVVVMMTIQELEDWSKTVFLAARQRKI
jgi:hypothetical protein